MTTTPIQRQAQARQAQAITRLGSTLLLLGLLGLPAWMVGLGLYLLIRRHRRRGALLALGLVVGLIVVGLSSSALLAELQALHRLADAVRPALRQLARRPTVEHLVQIQPQLVAAWPHVRTIWLLALPLAPLVALHLESSRTRSVGELRAEQTQQAQARDRQRRRLAAQQVAQAPEAVNDLAVIGVPLAGDLGWVTRGWATYAAPLLNRHAVIVGSSGTGKTEFVLRVAYLARKVYGWKVFYLDAKGDSVTALRFCQVMQQAGVGFTPSFPRTPYNGWLGDATAILNRLLSVEDYSEPYYKALARTVLTLAVKAADSPPRSSAQLLARLRLHVLSALHHGVSTAHTDVLGSLNAEHVDGVLRRYFGFFDALDGQLDGSWSFDSADAGYLLLEGLALKEEARALGRYLLEDFAHYAAKRKPSDQPVLLIIDEFSALAAGGADAANLFERLRSFGAGVLVTSQTNAGLGAAAAQLIGAAAVTIAFQCADADPIAARAGGRRAVETSYSVELPAMAGRNPLLQEREQLLGTATQHEREVPALHPDVIRRLGVGECCLIANGAYQVVRVARMPEARAAQPRQAGTPTPRSAIAITPPPRAALASPATGVPPEAPSHTAAAPPAPPVGAPPRPALAPPDELDL